MTNPQASHTYILAEDRGQDLRITAISSLCYENYLTVSPKKQPPQEYIFLMKISDDLFKDYLVCKYKVLLKREGKLREVSEYQRFQEKLEEAYRYNATAALFEKYKVAPRKDFTCADDFFKGYPLIFGVSIEREDMGIYIDAVEKNRGESALGSFFYTPILFLHRNKLNTRDKALLAFAGHVLEYFQAKEVLYGKVLYGDQYRISKVDLKHHRRRIQLIVREMRRLTENNNRPKLILNPNCRICEFQSDCEKKAIDKDHLSLLRGMTEKEIRNQNSRGIFTVNQYSYTFRPRRRRQLSRKSPKGRYHALQALAIREQKIFVYENVDIPSSPIRIYMDIEADPDRDFVYLIGLLIVNDKNEVHEYSFWADSQKEQNLIAERFLNVVNSSSDFLLFHYGSYEARFLKSLIRRLPAKYHDVLDSLLSKSVNVVSLIYENFYFPVYENSLKCIAGYLGFKWTDPRCFGLGSIMHRKVWEKNRNEELKLGLVTYNLEDCYALKKVVEYVSNISIGAFDNNTDKKRAEVGFVKDLKTEVGRKYKKIDFLVEDFEYINNCAYFNYQQHKVAVRTNRNLKKRLNKASKGKKSIARVNRIVECAIAATCSHCGWEKTYRHQRYERFILDLKFFKGGVKRWLTKYTVYRFRCTSCGEIFWGEEGRTRTPTKSKYGWNLTAWTIYENLVKGVSFRKIQSNLKDVFGISLSAMTINKFKSYVAEYYQESYDKTLERILDSHVILIDETTVRLRNDEGYVWILTNMEDVIYFYRSSREGAFLKELLKGFRGVLVSDFYPAYDSLSCAQQKCLIHLIRDLNDDLYKNPFDSELKELAEGLSKILKQIVKTIDRYGLRMRYLRRFNKQVSQFYEEFIGRSCNSEIVSQYHQRFKKNRKKLFTFINYDGVPWNNNAAEHAIKYLASYRKTVKGLLTERSLKDYLILLSVYQTCEYR